MNARLSSGSVLTRLLADTLPPDHTGAVLAGIAAIVAALFSGVGLVISAYMRRDTKGTYKAVNGVPAGTPPLSERVAGIEATVNAMDARQGRIEKALGDALEHLHKLQARNERVDDDPDTP